MNANNLRYVSIIILAICARSSAGIEVIFDNSDHLYGSAIGGFTGATVGVNSQIFVEHDIAISNIGELNGMPTSGQLIFSIWDANSRTKLFETNAMTYGPDVGSTLTWKVSPQFQFTLRGGTHYLVGATSDVRRFTIYDNIGKTQNGIQSDMFVWITLGFPPTSTSSPLNYACFHAAIAFAA